MVSNGSGFDTIGNATADIDWATLAAELGYADQSHLIREVKQFTGLTPGQLRSGQSKLTRATMDGRRSLGGKVSPLVSDS